MAKKSKKQLKKQHQYKQFTKSNNSNNDNSNNNKKKNYSKVGQPANDFGGEGGLAGLIERMGDISLNELSERPSGLANLGNTCYFNSTFQVLSQTYLFQRGLAQRMKQSEVSVEHFVRQPDGQLIAETIKLNLPQPNKISVKCFILLKQVLEKRPTSPGVLLSEINKLRQDFCINSQQDSHELLIMLLNSLKSEEENRQAVAMKEALGISKVPTEEERKRASMFKYAKKHTPIDAIFGGQLLSMIRCTACQHRSFSFEPFLNVSLSLKILTNDFDVYDDVDAGNKMKRKKGQQHDLDDEEDEEMSPLGIGFDIKEEDDDDRPQKLSKKDKKALRQTKKQAKRESRKQLAAKKKSDNFLKKRLKMDEDYEDNLTTANAKEMLEDLCGKEETRDKDADDADNAFAIVTSMEMVKDEVDDKDQLQSSPKSSESEFEKLDEDSEEKPDVIVDLKVKSLDVNTSDSDVVIQPNSEDDEVEVLLEPDQPPLFKPVDECATDKETAEVEDSDDSIIILDHSLRNGDTNNQASPSPSPSSSSSSSFSSSNEDSNSSSTTTTSDSSKPKMAVNISQEYRTKFYDYIEQVIAAEAAFDNGDLGKLFKNFFKEEVLDGVNRYLCEKCTHSAGDGQKVYTKAIRKQFMALPPPVFVVHMKCFERTGRSRTQKLYAHTTLSERLNLSPYTSRLFNIFSQWYEQQPDDKYDQGDDGDRLEYELYGVVVHSGGLSGGHYMSYVAVRPEEYRSSRSDKYLHMKPFVPDIEQVLDRCHQGRLLMREGNAGDDDSSKGGGQMNNGHPVDAEEEGDDDDELILLNGTSKPRPKYWYFTSDSSVQPTNFETLLRETKSNNSRTPYLLFYERIH